MNYKKLLTIGLAAAMVVMLTGSSLAFAETDAEKRANKSAQEAAKALDKMEQRLERGQEWVMKSEGADRAVMMKGNGEFHVKGIETVSVNASSGLLTVKFYGFTREFNVSSAKLLGKDRAMTLAEFQPGDRLAAWGKYDENTKVITVTEIRNLTSRANTSPAVQQRIEEILKMIRELQEKVNVWLKR